MSFGGGKNNSSSMSFGGGKNNSSSMSFGGGNNNNSMSFGGGNNNNNSSSMSFAGANNNTNTMSSMNRNASIMSGRVRESQYGSLKPALQNYITQLGVKILREKIEAKVVSEHSNQRLQVLYQQVNRLETDLTDIGTQL